MAPDKVRLMLGVGTIRKNLAFKNIAVAAGILAAGLLNASASAAASIPWSCAFALPTVAPVAGDDGWMDKFQDSLAAMHAHPPKVVFVGDSITEQWPDDLWQHEFKRYRAANFGISGDKIENILWRLANGTVDLWDARVFVVLAGTNNLGLGEDPATVADGIRDIVHLVHRRAPQARVVLLGLTPRDAMPDSLLRHAINSVNARIRTCGQLSYVTYLDVGHLLLDGHGKLTPDISEDALHFTHLGYERIMQPIATAIAGKSKSAAGHSHKVSIRN